MSDTPSDVGATGHPDPELLSAYVDGNLEPAEAAEVRGHLAGCPVCETQVEDLRLVRDVMRGLPFVDPPFGFYERTLRLGPRPRSRNGTRLMVSVVLGIVALAAILVVVAVVRHEPDAVEPTLEAAAVDVAEPAPTTQAPPTPPTSAPAVPAGMPSTIAGYAYEGQRTYGGDRFLVYGNGTERFAVTWDDGELDVTDLPAGTKATALAVGADGDTGWYVPAGEVDLVFVQRGDRVYTVVAPKGGDVGPVVTDLPVVDDDPSMVERAQSVGRSLLEAFGLGG